LPVARIGVARAGAVCDSDFAGEELAGAFGEELAGAFGEGKLLTVAAGPLVRAVTSLKPPRTSNPQHNNSPPPRTWRRRL